ncbi:MAG: hypothetical protein IJ062_07515 [Firmicutes bacterium]|nr:hypothetical protein [Bacillota bacterium]
MKRKIILILLCFALFSVTGCSKTQTPEIPDGKTEAVSAEEPLSEEPASEEPASEEPASEEPASEKPSFSEAVISYLGPEGTYTQEACNKFFGGEGTCVPYKTVDDTIAALINKETDYAVIPQENTIGGAVIDYVDAVIKNTQVSVVGEVELPINQNLLVLPETELSDIKTVYSHKQGIAQGKEFLERELPEAEVIEVSSTAEGAKMVSESKDKSLAAIASAGCADVYGLKILSANIQNNDKNKTRFYVLSLENAGTDSKERLAFVASGSAKDLPKLMSNIESDGAELVTVHDRPQKTELGSYNYLIECADCSYEAYEHITKTEGFEYRFLGCFDSY